MKAFQSIFKQNILTYLSKPDIMYFNTSIYLKNYVFIWWYLFS